MRVLEWDESSGLFSVASLVSCRYFSAFCIVSHWLGASNCRTGRRSDGRRPQLTPWSGWARAHAQRLGGSVLAPRMRPRLSLVSPTGAKTDGTKPGRLLRLVLTLSGRTQQARAEGDTIGAATQLASLASRLPVAGWSERLEEAHASGERRQVK